MKYFIAILLAFFVFTAYAEDKWLEYQYSKDVIIRILNVQCPITKIKKDYPWGAVAIRADGQYLFGCFNRQGDDDVVIQWAMGDKSIFPANYFLAKPTL